MEANTLQTVQHLAPFHAPGLLGSRTHFEGPLRPNARIAEKVVKQNRQLSPVHTSLRVNGSVGGRPLA